MWIGYLRSPVFACRVLYRKMSVCGVTVRHQNKRIGAAKAGLLITDTFSAGRCIYVED